MRSLMAVSEGIEDTRRGVAIHELVPERADPASVDELLRRLADARLATLDAGPPRSPTKR